MAARHRIIGAAVAACLAGLAALPPPPAAAKPARIVSLNLCADQLVLLLADRGAIAAVTYLARDPDISYMAGAARGLPVTYGGAEEVLALKADLVVAGAVTTRPTVALLRRLGRPVLELGVPDSLDAVRRQVRRLAGALGEAARGEALIAAMDARIASVRAASSGRRPVAAVYRADGFSLGAGSLADDILRTAGFDNVTGRAGMRGSGYLPLESLIATGPDLIVFGNYQAKYPSQAQQLLRHRALKAFLHGAPGRHVSMVMPARLWACGGPFNAEAVVRLAAMRARLGRAGRGR